LPSCVAIRHVRTVFRFRQGQLFGHFLLQPGFELAGVLMGERAVARGIGVNLGAIERHRTQFQQAHLARQHQHFDEDAPDLLEKTAPEGSQRVVIGVAVGGDEAEGNRVIRGRSSSCSCAAPVSKPRR